MVKIEAGHSVVIVFITFNQPMNELRMSLEGILEDLIPIPMASNTSYSMLEVQRVCLSVISIAAGHVVASRTYR